MVDESNPVISRFTNRIKGLINNKADKTNATQSDPGLMSAEDKIKLDAIDTQYSINVEKQSTADTGFFSTYVIKQNNTQKGVKINIPKDFLVKSATVKTCTTANNPIQGYSIGDKYIDFVINTKDSTGTDEHLYLAAKEIGAYPVDEVTLTVANGKLAVKNNGITWAKLATDVQNTINGKEVTSNKVNSVSANSTITQYPSAKCVYDTFCQKNDPSLSDARRPRFVHIGATSSNIQDLDDYTTGGFYYCNDDTNEAPYINNCPKTKGFFLLVERWDSSYYIKQTLTYPDEVGNTYIRIKKGSWTPWRRVQTTNNYISSTHTSPTSAWTGTSDEIVKLTKGTVIYYYLSKEPTTSPVTLNLTLANGDTTGVKNVYFSNGMRLSNQYASNSMICLYYSGSDWFVVNPYKYKGVTLASSGTNTAKPYYRLFHIESGNGNSRSSRLIFEISSKTSTVYAKFAVYMRQNTSTSNSTIIFQCLEKTDFDLNNISVGFRNNYPNTCCDIYINVNIMVHYIIKIVDDQLREGTYTQYSPTEGNIEAYTSVANAGTQLYGSAYTSITNPQWNIVATSIKKAGGTSSQFLKANGDVDTNVSKEFDYTEIKGTDNTAGYIKALQFKINDTYQDKPINIEIFQRDRKRVSFVNIKFNNINNTDPSLDYITHTESIARALNENIKVYMYKESASTWSLIVSKGHAGGKYGEMDIKIDNPNPNINITKLDTHIANLPSDTTNNPLKTSSCIDNTTPFTVTYTDGTTSTINFVTR